MPQAGLDNPDHPVGDPVLKIEDVLDRGIDLSAPRCAPLCGLDELGRNSKAGCLPPHASFEQVAHAEFAPDLARVSALPLYTKLELRAMTNSHLIRERPVTMSSTIPSAK